MAQFLLDLLGGAETPPPPPTPFSFTDPSTFVFRNAPLSDVRWPLASAVVYVSVVLLLSKRRGAGIDTTRLQAVHNLFLSIGSLAMLIGTLRATVLRTAAEPPSGTYGRATFLFCEHPSIEPNGQLYYWSYIYYLSKYYELLDTLLQLLKGRPPPHFFLHVYHHAAVLIMGWSWLEYAGSLQFIGMLFNMAVHVVMYFYYFMRVLNLPTPWKRLVTQFQIVQFATSFVCFLATLKLLVVDGVACSGTGTVVCSLLFNVTLLHSFVGVLVKGSKPAKSDKATDKAAKAK